MNIKRMIILCIIVLFCSGCQLYAGDIIYFERGDVTDFIPQSCDSVFIFTNDLGVTAFGSGITQLHYKDSTIYGENIPPTLRLRQPIGAILYYADSSEDCIPVIKGRMNMKMSKMTLLRNYITSLSDFKGMSTKGDVSIRVWEKRTSPLPWLAYLNNGRVVSSSIKFGIDAESTDTQNPEHHTNIKCSELLKSLSGMWIHPPEFGLDKIMDDVMDLHTQGPLVIEIWDGLSWDLLEKAYLARKMLGYSGHARMTYASFEGKRDRNETAELKPISSERNVVDMIVDTFRKSKIEYRHIDANYLDCSAKNESNDSVEETIFKSDSLVFSRAFDELMCCESDVLIIGYRGLRRLTRLHRYDEPTIDLLRQLWSWHLEIIKRAKGHIIIISDGGGEEFNFENLAIPVLVRP